jgi:hypothetical protein
MKCMALAKKRCRQRYSYKQKNFFYYYLQTASEERNFVSVIHQSPARYFFSASAKCFTGDIFHFHQQRTSCSLATFSFISDLLTFHQRHSLRQWKFDASPVVSKLIASDVHTVCQRRSFCRQNTMLLPVLFTLLASNYIQSPATFSLRQRCSIFIYIVYYRWNCIFIVKHVNQLRSN